MHLGGERRVLLVDRQVVRAMPLRMEAPTAGRIAACEDHLRNPEIDGVAEDVVGAQDVVLEHLIPGRLAVIRYGREVHNGVEGLLDAIE